MSALSDILARAESAPCALAPDELATLVALEDPAECRTLYAAAERLKYRFCGKGVAVRGLVELGNVCSKDCYYCGIRKSNAALARYQLAVADVVRLAQINAAAHYASLVLQSGEIESEAHTRYIEEILRQLAPFDFGITLSLGEQTEDVFRRWKAAGAARYLLRIETSDPELYAALHPASHSFARRVECLRALRRCNYQVGTGVMCDLPGQTPAQLARDILFFRDVDADMIGMGPYIPHPDTPLGKSLPCAKARKLRLGLNMIAATRLYLQNVNIAATTALQALAPDGREQGIRAGANVLMPNVTDTAYRRQYQLYAGKPALDETAAESRADLESRLATFGEFLRFNQRADSPHFFKKSPCF